MLVRGDPNGRVYPEKLFKVVGIYAAYVLADSAFARLDHGTGVQHIRLNCVCTARSLHLHNTPCVHTAYALHTHTHTAKTLLYTRTQPIQACCSSRICLPSCRRRAQAPRLAMTR